jgi:hypothetical protein
MKALVSAFALLTFVAGIVLPIQSHAQATTSGGGQTASPDTGTPSAPTASTKKKRSSKSHHAKKKSKKSPASQTSSMRQGRSGHAPG